MLERIHDRADAINERSDAVIRGIAFLMTFKGI